ncbi:MAG: AAA family ATPase [bacterium]|nr:AAA family ATPase [bacterium]
MELSIRLRRGLNIILGDVGTGKTTLSRALIQLFQGYEEFRFHLILDPSFNSEYEFLLALVKIFNIPVPDEKTSLAFKEAIRTNLLKEGLDRKRVVVLIIDEIQKMDYPFLELLRDFLNFETNEHKLLQLVLLGQMEFLDKIREKKNFMDRVNMLYFLKPLSPDDTREMIEFRLRKAGYFSRQPLFTREAYRKIYIYSQGYPRKIVNICHHCLLLMLIRKQEIVDRQIVELVVKSLFPEAAFPERKKFNLSLPDGWFKWVKQSQWARRGAATVAVLILLILGCFMIFRHRSVSDQDSRSSSAPKTAHALRNNQRLTPSSSPLKQQLSTSPHAPQTAKAVHQSPRPAAIPSSSAGQIADSALSTAGALTNTAAFDHRTALATHQAIGSDAQSNTKDRSQDAQLDFQAGRQAAVAADSDLSPQKAPIRKIETRVSPADDDQQSRPQDSTLGETRGGYRVVVAEKGDFISRMAIKLYGCEKVSDELLAAIRKANPHIANLNFIEPGQKVYFPDLTKKEEGGSSCIYGVQVGYFPTAAAAQDCLKKLSSIGSRIYIERDTLSGREEQYAVIIGPFADLARAWETIDRLQQKHFRTCRVVVISQD